MKYLVLALFCIVQCSCASPSKNIQPVVNSLVASNRLDRALEFLDDDPAVYGPHNGLLYWLDRGMTAHLAGHYKDSAYALDRAEHAYDELYTQSITQIAATWALNDNAKDYRGDDHEYVMVNIIQALNYAVLGEIDEAVVEARNIDMKLKLIDARFKADQKNVYKDDAFARLLSGILWQATGSAEGLNDAHIAYSRAMQAYTEAPLILKEQIAQTKAYMDYGTRPRDDKAHVYVIEFTGYVPVKVSDSLVIPLDSGHVTKFSFPRYNDRYSEVRSSLVAAISGAQEHSKETELVKDVGAVAKSIMDNRKAMLMAKAIMRPLLKYAVERTVEYQVGGRKGNLPSELLGVLGSVYNLATEEADLRSWQTLPNEIRIARLDLEPGTYEIVVQDMDDKKVLVEKRSLGSVTLAKGQNKFYVSRGYR